MRINREPFWRGETGHEARAIVSLSEFLTSWTSDISPETEAVSIVVSYEGRERELGQDFRAAFLERRVDYRLDQATELLRETGSSETARFRELQFAARWLETAVATTDQQARLLDLRAQVEAAIRAARDTLASMCTETRPERIRLWSRLLDGAEEELLRRRENMPTAVEYVDLAREVVEEMDNEFCAYVYSDGCSERRAPVQAYCPWTRFTGCTRWEEVDAFQQRAVEPLEDLAEAMHSGNLERIILEASEAREILSQLEFNAMSVSGYNRLRGMVSNIRDDAVAARRAEDLARFARSGLDHEHENYMDGDWLYVVGQAAEMPNAPAEVRRLADLIDEAALACESLSHHFH